MTPDTLGALAKYNAWANRTVLTVAATLSQEELAAQSSPSHSSVSQLLLHMLECETFFLSLCRGTPFVRLPALPTMADIRAHWDGLSRELCDFVASLTPDGLGRVLQVEIAGSQYQLPIWQLLSQAIVHSTHHRGELSIVLTALGRPLPNLDILLHFIEQSGQAWVHK